LSQKPPEDASLHWRPMGRGSFAEIPLTHVARGVYRVILPAANEDIEYFVKARVDGQELSFPATAPELSQTVIEMK